MWLERRRPRKNSNKEAINNNDKYFIGMYYSLRRTLKNTRFIRSSLREPDDLIVHQHLIHMMTRAFANQLEELISTSLVSLI